jgi:transglutaminase-like putative cysteine protease
MAVIFLFTAVVSVHAQGRFLHRPEPRWITQHSFDTGSPDPVDIADGYYYLMVNSQLHLEEKSTYEKYVIKVVSEAGLSFASTIKESFDPSCQQLIFHKLVIHRAGRQIDKMNKNKFEVIRREEDLERAVYDKSLTAIYNMPDVRIGDIVEYSFTRTGANPIFSGRSFGSLYFRYSMPVGKIVNRIIHDKARNITLKFFGTEVQATTTAEGHLQSTEWVIDNVPAVLADDHLPDWYNPYDRVQFSDFKSWDEVRAWARTLFQLNQKNNSQLEELLTKINGSGKSPEEKVQECIRFVQGDIRYLSFSDGIHSHKPHAPNQIISQKYGDCKDKSLLLSHMLNQIGIESYPALVSTDYGRTLDETLPQPRAFNHCILQFVLNDSTYWIDPTLNTQVGPLKQYYIPTYDQALVIDGKSTGLTRIPFGIKSSMIDIEEEYIVKELGGDVTLRVKTKYEGDEADETRSYRQSKRPEEINKSYLNFYANDYTDITPVKNVRFEDDSISNTIVTYEEYTIKNFWKYDAKTKKHTGSTYARLLSNYVTQPSTKIRTMPLRITHPRRVYQTIKIRFPEPWKAQEQATTIESEGFVYRSRSLYYEDSNTITLRYSYESKAGHVDTDKTADHIAKVDEVYSDLSYDVWYSDEAAAETDSGGRAIILIALIAIAIVVWKKRRSFR